VTSSSLGFRLFNSENKLTLKTVKPAILVPHTCFWGPLDQSRHRPRPVCALSTVPRPVPMRDHGAHTHRPNPRKANAPPRRFWARTPVSGARSPNPATGRGRFAPFSPFLGRYRCVIPGAQTRRPNPSKANAPPRRFWARTPVSGARSPNPATGRGRFAPFSPFLGRYRCVILAPRHAGPRRDWSSGPPKQVCAQNRRGGAVAFLGLGRYCVGGVTVSVCVILCRRGNSVHYYPSYTLTSRLHLWGILFIKIAHSPQDFHHFRHLSLGLYISRTSSF
jgi:hypothetical protein